MKLLYLSVDGEQIHKNYPRILEVSLKDYFTPEMEDPIWEFQFEEDFSLYISGQNVVFAVEGESEPGSEKETKGERVVGLKGRVRPSEETGPFKPSKPSPDKDGGKVA